MDNKIETKEYKNFPILVVDDEDIMRNALIDVLGDRGFLIHGVDSGEAALEYLKENSVDVVLTDLKMGGMSGLELLEKIKKINNNIEVVVMTAYGTIETAVSAMKNGAIDFITKPFSFDEIEIVLKRIWKIKKLTANNEKLIQENKIMKGELTQRHSFENIIGKSEPMQKIYTLIEKVSSSPATILVTGESGTGKELIAGAIHYNGRRRDKPFIKLNCAALPETLLESELFGYEKGAFTGAVGNKIGHFELANGGTLFLDEIGEIPISIQAKLLRVIQEKTFTKVGGLKNIKVDVRIVAATNIELEKAVKEGKFRSDLYFRLNVIPIHISPLRKRKEDIPLLVEHFMKKFNRENFKNFESVSTSAMKKIMDYKWPGNVRELMNIIERIIVLNDGKVIESNMIPEELGENVKIDGLGFPDETASLPEVEAFHIKRSLDYLGWNLSKAAKILQIDRKTLYAKIEKYGIKKED